MARILVVDDTSDMRLLLVAVLQRAGHEVIEAADGTSVSSWVDDSHPDLIILDLMMPGMDGFTTFQKLQDDAATRDIPVILLTANVQANDRLRFAELGVARVIATPFDPVSRPSQLAQVLGWGE